MHYTCKYQLCFGLQKKDKTNNLFKLGISQKLLDCICRKITISNFNRIREKWKYFRILERTKIYKLTLKAKNMYANFIVTNGKLSKLDKFIIVYNLDGLNEIFNIGFCFSKKKIQRQNDIVGIWKLKQKK